MKMTSKILDYSQTQLERWWVTYKAEKLGWAYLQEPSPQLLTTFYAEMVAEGSIEASEENVQAAQRHLKDLKRQGTDDFPWVFDEERAWRPIRFIEKKCKPSKGDFKQLVLQPWQHFIIGSMCGWVHRDSGIRRFREGVIFVGRKNGKTTLESGLADYMAGFDDERGANVYFLANSQAQARKLYDESKAMIEVSPYLSKRFVTTRSEIRFPKNHCTIVPMSAEKNNKDGENLHFTVFDEIHEYKDYQLISVMKRSRGARRQPLIIYISTAGTVLDGPLMDFVDNGKECLSDYDAHLDERTFYYLAKLDSIEEADDPELWVKANPNICMMSMVDMITDYKKDKKTPAEFADWITKQFNIFSSTDELSFVTLDTINKNNGEVDLESLEGMECIGGYDLSETEDFTAAGLEFKLEDGRVFWLMKSWVPQARFDIDKNPERLREWEQAGYLEIIPGDYVNYEYVYNWFVEQAKHYKISQINYDKAKALFLNQALIDYGFKTEITRQGFTTLGGPMQNVKELLLDGRVVTNNNKMFRWYLNNVKLVTDRLNNWMPTKQGRNRKIDGFAAFLNAHVTMVERLQAKPKTGRIKYVSFNDI
ncbi:terminase large subunit [Latilactobacillus curvatus]|uniref:terminase large subunit n=1 Tax=Latilactobacillus curvatus TaxID=28038 RepID=UPI0022F3C4AB|nr:terminase large subunit [Latilactobacillus curvatus]WBY48562.1 terminase large subunit [Latilactobacillus curvatus]